MNTQSFTPFMTTMFKRLLLLAMASACWMHYNICAADRSDSTEGFIAVLRSNAGLYEKARACQQLGEIGGKEAVPALAMLLGDEQLGAYARSGLEGIPDPSAAEALRTAAGSLKGRQLAGVINSLGVLRDARSVPLLEPLATHPDSGVAKEALLALGRIADTKAVHILKQSLSNGADTLRGESASACLLAAEQQLAEGHAATAVQLYDAVCKARVPMNTRAAATRGAILARKSKAPAFLMEQLRSKDRAIRNVALLTIREIPSDALASALNAELDKASPELQVQLLTALLDCHNHESLAAIKTKASSNEGEVRKTALGVLGQLGGPADAGVFLEALQRNRAPEETALALRILERMEGTAVDKPIMEALSSASEAPYRLRLVRLASARGMTNATAELLKQAAQSDKSLRTASLDALGVLAGPPELPGMISLTRTYTDEADLNHAGVAIIRICQKSTAPEKEAELLLAQLSQTSELNQKFCWLRVLATLGCPKVLPVLKADLRSTNDRASANAIELLGNWPDPAPIEDLLAFAESNEAHRASALEAGIRLAMATAENHQQPDGVIVEWMRRADKMAQTTKDRRLILSALGRLNTIESYRLLARHVADPELEKEAVIPIINMAPAVARQGCASEARDVLDKIAATATHADLRDKAGNAAANLLKQGLLTPIFDGHSMAGWEGNTNVWKVRDGVIVGGSLQGNAQNEFLATLRGYTNFVLSLEYKLVGTSGFINGGVQFHSVRLKDPAHEMAGFQADIGAGYSGCLYDESRRNKFLSRPAESQVAELEKANDWNRYEVRCMGPRIQIVLNGVKTVDYTETDSAIPLSGLVALQIHGNSNAEISFRNIVIQETGN